MVTRLLIALTALCLALPTWAEVTAGVDRTTMFSDESLVLTIRADFPSASRALDLTALGALFDIEGQSQSTQSRYSTSGGQQRLKEWQLRLHPKQTGTLAIPSFTLGDEKTDPIYVQVRDAAERKDGLPDDAVVLDAALSDDHPYVGEPITLTVSLKYQVRLQGGFDDLNLDGFDTDTPEKSNSVVTQGGRQYNQFQLVYHLTANKAGTLRIPDIRFSGQFQTGQFNSLRRLTRTHTGFDVKVKPIPPNYPSDAFWLPAESLSLSDNLSSDITLTANEHLNWVITTRVSGQPPTRLPNPIKDLREDHFRLYRNAPEFDPGEPMGSRKDMNALVFPEPGTYTLPAVRVPWWNLRTDQLAWAEIPARTVTVTPDPNAPATAASTVPASPAGTPTDSTPATAGQATGTGVPVGGRAGWWPWLSLALGIGWAATLVVWLASRRRVPAPDVVDRPATAATETLSDLKRRAATDRPERFLSALSRILARDYDRTLASVRPELTASARDTLDRLEHGLYGPGGGEPPARVDWRRLIEALERAVRPTRDARDRDPTRLYD